MQIIKLDGYNATVDNGKKLELGTFDSYGEEQLQIVKAQNWEDLSVIATFNPPNKKPVQVVVDSVTGVIKVPKEATANLYGVGTIVFVGLADGVQRISADVEYIVRKHSNANGTEPAEPTPSVVEQILTEAQNANTNSAEAKNLATDAKDIAQSVRDDADNGKFNGKDGKDGAKGDKGETGTTPQLKIGKDNLWNVSYDNGETWVSLGVKATGDAGKDGKNGLTPHIGENGNWWLGDTDTGVSAKGPKGDPGPQGPAGEIPEDYPQIREDVSKLKEDVGELNTSVFNIKESPNIFDKTKINQGKALVTWGTPTMTNYTYDRTGWATSYPIPVHGGSTIYSCKFENGNIKIQNIANLITFAKDGSFIALEGQNKHEIKLSENAAYIIFDTNNLSAIDSLMLTTDPYNGAYQEYGRIKEDKIAKIAEDVSKINSDKTHIIFSFDAFKIDNRFELMKSYGFPFTIAIAQTTLQYPISKDDYYNYFVDGDVDFSVYAGKGDIPTDYRSDKDKWSTWVKGLVDGLKETSGLYYPVMYSCQNAASSDILNQVVKENGFRMCRNGVYYNADGTTTYGNLTDRKYLIDGTKYFDYYPLLVVKQEGYPTVEQIKAEIDNAIEKKKSIMLFTHYVIDDTQTMSDTDCPLSKFTAVLDYVKEKVDAGLCDVKNARQFWNCYNQQDGSDIDYKRTNMRNLFDTTH